MDERAQRFLEVSARLTGFTTVELAGTGMTEDYLQALDEILPAAVLDQLLAAGSAFGDVAIGKTVLEDATLGPVARNIILLWYRGTWSALPPAWRAAHGASPGDVDRVISGAAYQAGLQWAAAGAHPAGAAQQGYAAWAAAPKAVAP